jgi:hypothetical protein
MYVPDISKLVYATYTSPLPHGMSIKAKVEKQPRNQRYVISQRAKHFSIASIFIVNKYARSLQN